MNERSAISNPITTTTSSAITSPAAAESPVRRREAVAAACFALMVVASACGSLSVTFGDDIEGSGNRVDKDYDLSGFDEITIAGAFDLVVTHGDTHSVAVTTDDNLLPYLEVGVSGDTLQIDTEDNVSFRSSEPVRFTVTLPSLTVLDADGAVDIDLDGIGDGTASGDLHLKLDGAVNVEGSVELDELDVDVDGSSDVTLTGSTSILTLSASGGSDIDLAAMIVGTATVDLDGAIDAAVHVTDVISGSVDGAVDLTVFGNPSSTNVSASGASDVDYES